MTTKDSKGYYAILGLAPGAGAAQIKAAYRRKAMELHPDRNKSPEATKQFQLLIEAYSILGDPATRAQYDTMSIETGERVSASAEEPLEPIVCSCCGKVTAQPRYAIFYEVKSFIFATTRSAIQGIFCSACAEKKAFKASAITWLLGWWGIPWGFIYSIHALFNNLMGGQQPPNINARLATHQAWVFAVQGRIEMARAIALDALALTKKIKPNKKFMKMRKALGYEANDEVTQLQAQIEKLLEAMGANAGKSVRLKNSWALLRRPFYIQGLVILSVIGAIWYAIATAPPSSPPRGPKPYVYSPPPSVPAKPAYVRPATAPNGEAWPVSAGYVRGYPRIHTNGLSKVTIDNGQNNSDVFVKLVSLDGPKAIPVRSFFIPAHDSFTLNNITAGSYDMRYRDLNSGHLSRSEQFTLNEIQTYNGTQYSNLTMTLYKVRNGNMQSYDLREDEF